jgi:hypothetical protein
MRTLIVLFALLAEPDQCMDRKPGLSKCITYRQVDGRVTCEAACYSGRRPDGGTYATLVKGSGKDEPACKQSLEAACATKREH